MFWRSAFLTAHWPSVPFLLQVKEVQHERSSDGGLVDRRTGTTLAWQSVGAPLNCIVALIATRDSSA